MEKRLHKVDNSVVLAHKDYQKNGGYLNHNLDFFSFFMIFDSNILNEIQFIFQRSTVFFRTSHLNFKSNNQRSFIFSY